MLWKKFQEAAQSAQISIGEVFFALWGYIIVRPNEKGESDSNPSIQPANRPEKRSRRQNKSALARACPLWLLYSAQQDDIGKEPSSRSSRLAVRERLEPSPNAWRAPRNRLAWDRDPAMGGRSRNSSPQRTARSGRRGGRVGHCYRHAWAFS